MNLINMERPKPVIVETKAAEPMVSDSYYEKFPYGLRVNLRNDEIKKLGIDVANIKAGFTGTLNAKFIFTEVRSNESMDKDGKSVQDDNLELQLTDMAIEQDNNDFNSAFDKATETEDKVNVRIKTKI